MMLTQRFAPEDTRREGAFLWNYAGMNIGFLTGFAVAGHFQLQQQYGALFWFACVGNAVAVVLAAVFWRTLADRDTPLLAATPQAFWLRFALGPLVVALHSLGRFGWARGFCLAGLELCAAVPG